MAGPAFYVMVMISMATMVLCTFDLPQPPPFPDIEDFISYSRFSQDMKPILSEMCNEYNRECNCTACLVENWPAYRANPENYTDEALCDQSTTLQTTGMTRPSQPPASSLTSVTSIITTTVIQVPSSSATTKPNIVVPSESVMPTTTTTNTMEQTDSESTTIHPTVTPVFAETKSKLTNDSMIAIVCGCLLAVLAIIAILFMFRRVAGGTAIPRHEKMKRQRSDCQHLPSNQENAPDTPSPDGNGRLANGYSNIAFQGQEGSELDSPGADSTRLILNGATVQIDYSTLKVLNHPHALNMGGFGESTDTMTLKKKGEKKKRLSKKKSDGSHSRKGSLGASSSESISGVKSKGSVSSKASVKSKTSLKSKSADKDQHAKAERKISIGGPANSMNATLPQSTSLMMSGLQNDNNDDDELVNNDNAHLFAFDNPAITSSATNLSTLNGSSIILAPPPEFQDDRMRESPFNSVDRRHIDDPPTAIVRPSVKEEPGKVRPSPTDSNKPSTVYIPMEDMSRLDALQPPEAHNTTDLSTANNDAVIDKPTSFLWSIKDKPQVKQILNTPTAVS